MYRLRSLILVFIAALCASPAFADDEPITFTRTMKSAPDGEVLFGIPLDLDLEKKITIVVYFHGLLGDESFGETIARQQIAAQVADAHINAVLIAPSIDYSMRTVCSGRKKKRRCRSYRIHDAFADKGAFEKFLKAAEAEAAKTLNTLVSTFDGARLVLIGYSAGHNAVRHILLQNTDPDGVILLDAHYGSQNAFAHYAIDVAESEEGFFVSSHTDATKERAKECEEIVKDEDVVISRQLPDQLGRGEVVIIEVEGEHLHYDFVTKAWTENPVADVLKRIN